MKLSSLLFLRFGASAFVVVTPSMWHRRGATAVFSQPPPSHQQPPGYYDPNEYGDQSQQRYENQSNYGGDQSQPAYYDPNNYGQQQDNYDQQPQQQQQYQQYQQHQQHQQEPANDGLVLNDLDQEMGQFASKYTFSESDFLAAARRRAEQRTQSATAGASDSDWKSMADENEKKYGKVDDWENAVKEAGNTDSQILMFTDPPAGDDDDGEAGDEPKLLLF